jgi:cathepsin B
MQPFVVIVVVAASFGLANARVIVDRDPRMHISDQVNAMNTTWTARNNDAHKYKLGVASDAIENMRKNMPVRLLSPPASGLPDSFDARDQWPNCADVINDIRNQGQCGDCWAVATAGVFSDRLCIATNGAITVPYSSWDITTCSGNSNGCNGGDPKKAWDWLVSNGVVTGGPITNPVGCKPFPSSFDDVSCYQSCQSGYNTPYDQDGKQASTSFMIAQDQTQIMTHIMNEGSIDALFHVYGDFMNYQGGVYQHVTGTLEGGHAVRVIGWGVDSGTPYWLVANSWGTDWGLNGFFKILRGSDECGFEEYMCAGLVNSQSIKKSM